MNTIDIEQIFDRLFHARYRTVLLGGAQEPLYEPATDRDAWHIIWYRDDFVRSALHEVAHWCIAGAGRRQKQDYGYWYHGESRTRGQQNAFQRVEVKPQALEYLFCQAVGVPFSVSLDNFSGSAADGDDFAAHVAQQARAYLSCGMPERAARFLQALRTGVVQQRKNPAEGQPAGGARD